MPFDGSYNAAFYIQNLTGSNADLTVQFVDSAGTLSCIDTDSLSNLEGVDDWVPSMCAP
jgi:hypothetical protein